MLFLLSGFAKFSWGRPLIIRGLSIAHNDGQKGIPYFYGCICGLGAYIYSCAQGKCGTEESHYFCQIT
jgi:hypothetical protein